MFGLQQDGVTPVTYLQDIMSVITDVMAIFTTEPVIYFVMLGLVGASVGVVRKLVPMKRK